MRQVTVHVAKPHPPRLIEAALAGKDVVIARGDTPVVRSVPISVQKPQVGLLAGRLGDGPDFLAAPDEAELEL